MQIEVEANNMHLKFPHDLFINGKVYGRIIVLRLMNILQFEPSSSGRTYDTINPTNEEVICKVCQGKGQMKERSRELRIESNIIPSEMVEWIIQVQFRTISLEVAKGCKEDCDKAVAAAKKAFEQGEEGLGKGRSESIIYCRWME